MNYEKPTIHVAGSTQALVLGTKPGTPTSDSPNMDPFRSVAAYEADE